MSRSVSRKTRPSVQAGVHSEAGPSASFVEGDYDEVLAAELRAPDHRCGPRPATAKLGDRFTCDSCGIEYAWREGKFDQWLPVYEQTGQLPHSHVQHGDLDEADADGSWSSFGAVSLGEAV